MAKQRTYTENLEAILERLGTPDTAVELLNAHLEHLELNQQELIALARATNGRVQENSQAIAALAQWKVDHEKANGHLRSHVNRLTAVHGAIAAIAGSLSSIVTTLFQR